MDGAPNPFRENRLPPPPNGTITLGEVGGVLYQTSATDSRDSQLITFKQNRGRYFPLLHCSFDLLSTVHKLSKTTSCTVNDNRSLPNIFDGTSIFDFNKALCRNMQAITNSALLKLRHAADTSLLFSPLHFFLRPVLPPDVERGIYQSNKTKQLRSGPTRVVKSIAWHSSGILAVLVNSLPDTDTDNGAVSNRSSSTPCTVLLVSLDDLSAEARGISAISMGDDKISTGDLSSRELVHEFQTGCHALAWVPDSTPVLAVSCRGGILLWSTELNLSHLVPGAMPAPRTSSHASHFTASGVAVFYAFPDTHAEISVLSFTPQGGRYLAAASASSCTTVIYDISHAPCSAGAMVRSLRTLRGAPHSLSWSPEGTLFAMGFTHRAELLVYQTNKWCSTSYAFPGAVRKLQWAVFDDGRTTLLVSCTSSSALYFLSFPKPVSNAGVITKVISCDPYIARDRISGKPCYVGADLSSTVPERSHQACLLAWSLSRSLQRLCVGLEDGHIEAFRHDGARGFSPIGVIRAHPDVPGGVRIQQMEFVSTDWGEVLSVLWDDSSITFTSFMMRHGSGY